MITNLQNINPAQGQPNININSTNTSVSSDTAENTTQNTLANIITDNVSKEMISSNVSSVNNKTNETSLHSLSDDTVKSMTDKLNEMASDMNLQLKFVWYKQLDQLGVRMVDINTNKTIKSFPPEDVMKALIRTKEWVGKFLDKEI